MAEASNKAGCKKALVRPNDGDLAHLVFKGLSTHLVSNVSHTIKVDSDSMVIDIPAGKDVQIEQSGYRALTVI